MYNIKFKLNGYNYLCLRCQEFSKQPQMCQLCRGVICFKCISINERCVRCNCKCFSPMLMSLQYIYDKSSINCEICKQELPLRKIQKHQKICYKQQNQGISFLPVQQKYHQSKTFDYIQNTFLNYVDKADEENIIELQNLQLNCLSCQQRGNYFQMLNHSNQCQIFEVNCQCKSKYQRYQFSDHIQSCFAIQILQKQTELGLVQQILNYSRQKYQFCHIEQLDDDIAQIVEDIYDDIQQTNCSNSQQEDDSYQ